MSSLSDYLFEASASDPFSSEFATEAVSSVGRFLAKEGSKTSAASMNLTIYDTCLDKATTGGVVMLECVVNELELGQNSNAEDSNTWFTIFAAALIFFMQAGFAMLCAGSVRVKNVGTYMYDTMRYYAIRTRIAALRCVATIYEDAVVLLLRATVANHFGFRSAAMSIMQSWFAEKEQRSFYRFESRMEQ